MHMTFTGRISISSPSSHCFILCDAGSVPTILWTFEMQVTCNFLFLYLIRNGNIGSIQKAEKHKENEISIILSTTNFGIFPANPFVCIKWYFCFNRRNDKSYIVIWSLHFPLKIYHSFSHSYFFLHCCTAFHVVNYLS